MRIDKVLIEFIGTFFLMLIIILALHSQSLFAPLAIGLGLSLLIYLGGKISGAHYNPAVTIGILAIRGISIQGAIIYIIVQVIGAIAGVLVGSHITESAFSFTMNTQFAYSQALIAEMLFSFLLVLVILYVAHSKRTIDNQYYGLAIGFTVFVGAVCIGGISGAALNPAIAIGPWLYGLINNMSSVSPLRLYIIGPCLGAILASGVYTLMDSGLDAKPTSK